MENKFGKNLRFVRKSLKLTQNEFGKPLNILGSTISAIELGKSKTSNAVIELIEIKYQINRDWLMTGDGEMILKPERSGPGVTEEVSIYKVEKPLDDDPIVAELLEAARKVLKSGNRVAVEALERNIRYFAHTIEVEIRMYDVESRLSRIESGCMERQQAEKDGKIRKNDPAQQKEVFLKMRETSFM